MEWLYTAYHAYARLGSFRQMRAECKDYSYGRQYKKSIVVNGKKMTKEAYLTEKGIPALQTNILGKIKRVVQGQFRLNDTAPVCNSPDPNEKQAAESGIVCPSRLAIQESWLTPPPRTGSSPHSPSLRRS